MEKTIKIGLTPRGAYSTATTYDYLDIVTHQNRIYVSLRPDNAGNPLSSIQHWQLMAEGIKGNPGKDGYLAQAQETTTTRTLQPNTLHRWGAVESLTLTLQPATRTDIITEYAFQFTCPADRPTTLALPATVRWYNGYTPTLRAGRTYQASIVDNIIILGGAD